MKFAAGGALLHLLAILPLLSRALVQQSDIGLQNVALTDKRFADIIYGVQILLLRRVALRD